MSTEVCVLLLSTHVGAITLGVIVSYYTREGRRLTDLEIHRISQIIENLKEAHVDYYNELIVEWEKALTSDSIDVCTMTTQLHSIVMMVKTRH